MNILCMLITPCEIGQAETIYIYIYIYWSTFGKVSRHRILVCWHLSICMSDACIMCSDAVCCLKR